MLYGFLPRKCDQPKQSIISSSNGSVPPNESHRGSARQLEVPTEREGGLERESIVCGQFFRVSFFYLSVGSPLPLAVISRLCSESMRGDNRSRSQHFTTQIHEKTIADRRRRSGDGEDVGQKWVSRDEDEIVYDRCKTEPVTKGKAISRLQMPHYDSEKKKKKLFNPFSCAFSFSVLLVYWR